MEKDVDLTLECDTEQPHADDIGEEGDVRMAGEGSNSSIAKRIRRSPRRRQPLAKQISPFVTPAAAPHTGSIEWGMHTRPKNGSGRRPLTQAKRKRWKRYGVAYDRQTTDMAVVVPVVATGSPDHGLRGIHDMMGYSKEAQDRRGAVTVRDSETMATVDATGAPISQCTSSAYGC
ncbi:hypothetical protein Cgig2_026214 [Carnegiea gigantea]|uniref:Uncharacterized protein n=1 Tax=Carnegiea gigantea TaxID=171969 RepID=A0A9Q1GQF4_9CARY|nr:hypothetical protein Cgig2_026214 [Carnegiea gigantea]